MNPGQMTLADSSRSARLFQTAIGPALDETDLAQFIKVICEKGDCLHLRPQQRVPLAPAGKVVVLREGMFAIDAMPAKGKLQVLDFPIAGDVVSASTVLPAPMVSLRAITCASLVALDPPAVNWSVPNHDYWGFLVAQCLNQMARVNVHQLLIGRLDTEQRVASFILSLALRSLRKDAREVSVEFPMSRTDIANYLVINCDTLSRTMMRFCDCGLIKREGRHAIRVINLDALRKKSPLASLLSAMFEEKGGQQKSEMTHRAEEYALMPLVLDSPALIPLIVTAARLPPSTAKDVHASRRK